MLQFTIFDLFVVIYRMAYILKRSSMDLMNQINCNKFIWTFVIKCEKFNRLKIS